MKLTNLINNLFKSNNFTSKRASELTSLKHDWVKQVRLGKHTMVKLDELFELLTENIEIKLNQVSDRKGFSVISDFDAEYYVRIANEIIEGGLTAITSNPILIEMKRFVDVHHRLGHEVFIRKEEGYVILYTSI